MGKKRRKKMSSCRGCRMAGGKPACTFRFAAARDFTRVACEESPFRIQWLLFFGGPHIGTGTRDRSGGPVARQSRQ